MASLNVAMMAFWSSLGAERRDAWWGWEMLGVAGPAAGTPIERALSFVCSPPLWHLLLLLLSLTAGLALHFALLQLLGNLPRRRVGRLGKCRLCCWPLALSADVLFLLAALCFAPGTALAGAILLSSALLLAATGGLMCVLCVRRWRSADLAAPLAFGLWLALAEALLLFWNGG